MQDGNFQAAKTDAPVMTKTRDNVELRFWSAASLEDILRGHGV